MSELAMAPKAVSTSGAAPLAAVQSVEASVRGPVRGTARLSRGERWGLLGALAVLWAVYVLAPVHIQTDSIWTIPTVASLLQRGDMNLDEYRETRASSTAHGTRDVGEHVYFDYPMGAVLAAAPFVAVFDGAASLCERAFGEGCNRRVRSWRAMLHRQGQLDLGLFRTLEGLIASAYVCLAALFVYLTARRRGAVEAAGVDHRLVALAVALVFALGTSAFSTASRVLWQHAPSLAAIAAIVFLVTSGLETRRGAFLLGLTVAVAYVCRPTNAITVAVVSLWLATARRAHLPAFLLGGASVAAPFVAYNLATYGAVLAPYYTQILDPTSASFAPALAANLVSPSRGLFVFTPVVLLSLGSYLRGLVHGRWAGHEHALAAIPVLTWVAVSAYPCWWAGHSVGPRFLADVLPCMAYFLIDPFAAALRAGAPLRRRALVGVAVLWSVFVHARASVDPAVHGWNDGPPNVDAAPARVWDLRDPQPLRGL